MTTFGARRAFYRRPPRRLRRCCIGRLLVFTPLLAFLALACKDASGDVAPTPTAEPSAIAADAPVIVAARVVCNIARDVPSARAAGIDGLDGAQSVRIGDTSLWFFGDTIRRAPDGRQDVIPASFATAADTDAADCLDLRFKTVRDQAEPLFPRGEETTAWPDGVLPLDDGSVLFYMVKAVRQSPFAWNVGSVGLGRLPAGSSEGERIVETLWDENSGFDSRIAGVRSPIRAGEYVYVYIATEDGDTHVARVREDGMDDVSAYAYWDGDSWSDRAGDAAPLWPHEESGFPPDNGVQVTRDADGRYVAISNGRLATVEARTAPEPWGPWSAPVTWLDCRTFAGDRYPFCYSAELHRHLTQDRGALYMTVSTQEPYDVALIELTPGAPVHEWRDASGARRYAFERPGADFEDAGVAFYASPIPAQGLVPAYVTEGAMSIGGGSPDEAAFWVMPALAGRTVPSREITAGGATFRTPCPRFDLDANRCG